VDPFRDRNRGLASIHSDEQAIVLKTKALMAEYMYFKYPFPDATQILTWVREAWRESEDDLGTCTVMSSESLKYVHCYCPRSEILLTSTS
jgi:hypothetical protein